MHPTLVSGKQYDIIYADPPWSFRTWSDKGKGRSAEKHYNTMTKTDIQQLQVPSSDNCVLFLWVTSPCLIEGIELCKAWGFEYKTVGFIWIKTNKKAPSLFWGMGYWTRANAEYCLIATKGKPKRINAGVHQVVMSPVRKHSQKPDEVRDRIVKLVGDLPRIELFARETSEGWDSWGDEIN